MSGIVNIYSVTVEAVNGRWEGTFVGKPTDDEVKVAMLDKFHILVQEEADMAKRSALNTNFRNLIDLVTDFSLPPVATRICKYAGTKVGTIIVEKSGEAKISNSVLRAVVDREYKGGGG